MTILFSAQLLITLILVFWLVAASIVFVSASFILYETLSDYVFAKFYTGYKVKFHWVHLINFLSIAFAIGVLITALVWVAPFSVVIK